MHTSSTCGINGMNEGDEVGRTTMEEGMLLLGTAGFVIIAWMMIGDISVTPTIIGRMTLVDAVELILF